jgi:ribosome-associated protein
VSPSPDNSASAGAGEVHLAPGVRAPEGSLRFAFSRSRGPGGQNVNRRLTRAELRVRLRDLPLDAASARRLAALAGRRLVSGEIVFVADRFRSQGRNRDDCIDRLRALVARALTPPVPRRPTKPSAGARARRLEAKRARSNIKRARAPVRDD